MRTPGSDGLRWAHTKGHTTQSFVWNVKCTRRTKMARAKKKKKRKIMVIMWIVDNKVVRISHEYERRLSRASASALLLYFVHIYKYILRARRFHFFCCRCCCCCCCSFRVETPRSMATRFGLSVWVSVCLCAVEVNCSVFIFFFFFFSFYHFLRWLCHQFNGRSWPRIVCTLICTGSRDNIDAVVPMRVALSRNAFTFKKNRRTVDIPMQPWCDTWPFAGD